MAALARAIKVIGRLHLAEAAHGALGLEGAVALVVEPFGCGLPRAGEAEHLFAKTSVHQEGKAIRRLQLSKARGAPKPTALQRADIVENVRSGHRTAVQTARLYKVSKPIISRILGADQIFAPGPVPTV